MLIIKNGEIYSPQPQGVADILIGGRKILCIEPNINISNLPGVHEVIDANGSLIIPGFIDGHQHFIGGGGEGGFQTRTPEMNISTNFINGVTTAVGLLGTDSLTRSVENLYAKTQSFNQEGMTAFMLTGAYGYPSPTLTGSVAKDIAFLESVIGVKLALADTRGSHIEAKELAILASDVQVSALVAHKPGIITVHTGVKPESLDLIFEIIDKFKIRSSIFIPTHINRKGAKLIEQSLALAEMGGVVDATCQTVLPPSNSQKITAADFAMLSYDNGLLEHVSFSSDAGGSLPIWNADRSRITGMGIGNPASLLFELNLLVNQKHLPLHQALLPLTITPARSYGLEGRKGALHSGMDADIIILDQSTFSIRDVIANGEIAVRDNIVKMKGYFE